MVAVGGIGKLDVRGEEDDLGLGVMAVGLADDGDGGGGDTCE